MKIISFSGVDGSGKSTQASLLKEHYRKHGYTVDYFHATEFSLANRLQRNVKKQKSFTPGEEPAVVKASFLSVLLRLVFLGVDGIRFPTYKHHLAQSGVTVLISDRFFQDSLINAAFLSQNFLVRGLIRFLAKVLPLPEQSFYLKLSLEDILSRARLPEQGREYIREKIQLYNNPAFSWAAQVLDATQPPAHIHQLVLDKLRDL